MSCGACKKLPQQREVVRDAITAISADRIFFETGGAIIPLDIANLDRAAGLLAIPQEIKGFGHVREKAMQQAGIRLNAMKSEFLGRAPSP